MTDPHADDDASTAQTPPDTTDGSAPTSTDAIRSEIEQTRADLSDTVDQLADKLNVKNQVGSKAESVKESVTTKASELKTAAPEPVQHALDKAGETVGPAAHRINVQTQPHRGKIALGLVAALLALVIVRKVRGKDEDR